MRRHRSLHSSTTRWIRLLSMTSIASNFLSTWASVRGAPEVSTQRLPTATPQIGQVMEDTCLGLSSLFFMVIECDYTQSQISSNLHTAT